MLLGWHLPALFETTLESEAVHVLEHVLFFAVALLFFKHLIPSPPLRAPLGDGGRALYAVAGMTVSWILAVALAVAPNPLYPHDAELAARPGGISALADQQLAAGVMWVPARSPSLSWYLSTYTAGSRLPHRKRASRATTRRSCA